MKHLWTQLGKKRVRLNINEYIQRFCNFYKAPNSQTLQSCHFCVLNLWNVTISRGIFRSQSNISEEAVCKKYLTAFSCWLFLQKLHLNFHLGSEYASDVIIIFQGDSQQVLQSSQLAIETSFWKAQVTHCRIS